MGGSDDAPKPSWGDYQRQIYASFERPALSTDVRILEQQAKERLAPEPYNYVAGSAGQGRTNAANLAAFDRWRIRPNMLVAANNRSTKVTLFGQEHVAPVVLAPIGVQGICHKEGEEASARGAANVGIAYTMSSASTRSIEDVAEASGNDALKWYQLYWPKTNEVLKSVLERAQTAGFSVLVVTLDTMQLGWRPLDIDRAYLPFLNGVGSAVGFSDPAFMKQQGMEHHLGKAAKDIPSDDLLPLSINNLGEFNSGLYRSWDDLKLIKAIWKGPIVLKGIQTLADAHRAIDYGVDGIVVSNHGGRQVDGTMASLDALAIIGQDTRVREKLTVLFDSGIRTGSDVFKALALGAQAVLLGRPYMYGLTLGGEAGVEHVIRCVLADLELTMALTGHETLADISRSSLDDTHARPAHL